MLKKLDNYCGKSLEGNKIELFSAEDDPIILRISKSGKIFRQLIRTGLAVASPTDEKMLVQAVPGLAQVHGITIFAPTFLTDDYYGEIKLVLANFGDEVYTIYPGNKIAEAIII